MALKCVFNHVLIALYSKKQHTKHDEARTWNVTTSQTKDVD